MSLRISRRLFVVGFAIVLIQVAVLSQVTVAGAHPDALLLLAVAAGLAGGAQQGAVVAFLAGLVADLFVVTPYGLSALCYVLVAFTVGLVASLPAGRAPRLVRVVVSFAASVAGTLLYAGLCILVGQPHLSGRALLDVVLVVSVANAVLAIPTIAAVQWAFAGNVAGAHEYAAASGSAAR